MDLTPEARKKALESIRNIRFKTTRARVAVEAIFKRLESLPENTATNWIKSIAGDIVEFQDAIDAELRSLRKLMNESSTSEISVSKSV